MPGFARAIDHVLHRFVFRGRHHQNIGEIGERNHSREILLGIVGEICECRRRDGVRRRINQQRIAIRIGLRDRIGTKSAARADAIVDHERLSDLIADLLEYRSRDRVGCAACREGNDHLDRLARGPGRRLSERVILRCESEGDGKCYRQSEHERFPGLAFLLRVFWHDFA